MIQSSPPGPHRLWRQIRLFMRSSRFIRTDATVPAIDSHFLNHSRVLETGVTDLAILLVFRRASSSTLIVKSARASNATASARLRSLAGWPFGYVLQVRLDGFSEYRVSERGQGCNFQPSLACLRGHAHRIGFFDMVDALTRLFRSSRLMCANGETQ